MLRIVNGKLYDPANGVDGEVRTLAIREGRIVTEEKLDGSARTLDARGLLVIPGGVDVHSHIAGPKVNAARQMRPEDHRPAAPVPARAPTRSGVMGSVPATFATGYLYAGSAIRPPSTRPCRRLAPATRTKSCTTRPSSTRVSSS